MLTMKKLNEKINKLEKELIRPINDVDFIARTYIYTSDETYEKDKENLIKRGFKLIKTEELNTLLYRFWSESRNGSKETWEKEYANGEF